ncbi:DNA gyrase inhibitor YacG [Bradyrhizobium sp.]
MPAKPPDDAKENAMTGKASARSCPICGKPATEASKPFCSERCRDVDLNRWLSDSYKIPAARDDDEDAE